MPDADQKPSGTPRWLWPVIAVVVISRYRTVLLERPARDDGAARRADARRDARSFARRADARRDARSFARRADAPATPAPSPVAQTPPATPAPSPVAQTPPATPAPSPVAQTPAATPAPSPLAQTPAATPAPSPVAQTPAATPAPAPVAQTPPATPAPSPVAQAAAVAPATEPPRLELSNEDGVVHALGSVHDEGAKVSILDALKSVFGADKVQADIGVDANRGPAPWRAKLGDALASLKTRGVQAVFDGDSVNVGGAIGDADRDRIITSLKGALGEGLSYGVLKDRAAEASSANEKATTELTSLTSAFSRVRPARLDRRAQQVDRELPVG